MKKQIRSHKVKTYDGQVISVSKLNEFRKVYSPMKLPSSAIKLKRIVNKLKINKDRENKIYKNNVKILRNEFEKAKLLNINTQKEIRNLKELRKGFNQSQQNFRNINNKLRKLIPIRTKTLNKIKKKIKKQGKSEKLIKKRNKLKKEIRSLQNLLKKNKK